MKKIITIIALALLLTSCGVNTKQTKKENPNSKLTTISQKKINQNISLLDDGGKKLVIEYFKTTDKNKKTELKEKIQKHMLEIQSEISKVKGNTLEEKNKQIQEITKKIKLYKILGF